MRLTRKYKNSYNVDEYYTNGKISSGIVYIDDNKNFTNACIDKLGQLEDIEDEIGIDLIVLVKAVKNGIWYKNDFNEICYCEKPYLYFDQAPAICKFFLRVSGLFRDDLTLKRYGRTWALTKEELLHE